MPRVEQSLVLAGSVVGPSACSPKGSVSGQGHLPGLWGPHPVGVHAGGNQSPCLSHTLSLSHPLPSTRPPCSQVLCNGPGTCVPICAAAVLLGVLGVKRVTVVYVESLCRVEHLSLTGRILRPFADYFLVQWPALKRKYPTSVYLGRIV